MSRSSAFPALIAILLLGFALRLYQLGTGSLRGDEAFSALNWSGLPLSASLARIATIEPHPPLTYVVFRAWGLSAGLTPELALRLLPALTNLLGIAALYRIGRLLGGGQAGILAALLWACHPYLVWHSQDYRNYALWAGFSAITLWFGLRALRRPTLQTWGIYTALALFTALIFYNELFSLAALALAGLWMFRARPRRAILWACLHLAIATGVGAIFIALQAGLFSSGSYGGNTQAFDASALVLRFVPVLLFGETLPATLYAPVGIVASILMTLALWQQRQNRLLLGLLIGIPLLLLTLISLRVSIFNPRYVLSIAAPMLVLLALSLVALGRKQQRMIAISVGLALGGGAFLSFANYYANPSYAKAPDWRALVDQLKAIADPQDAVIQSGADAAYGYYFNHYSADVALPGTPRQSAEDIEAQLTALAQQYPILWHMQHTQLDWPNRHIANDWLEANMQRVYETRLIGRPLIGYMPWEVSARELTSSLVGAFPDVAELRGYRVWPLAPDGTLHLWLYWQPQAQTPRPLKVFVHLIGAWNPTTQSPLWAQDDHEPQFGRSATIIWHTDALVRDVYRLSLSDLPAGEYQLCVGFYDPDTQQRVLSADGSESLCILTYTQP